MIDLEVAGRENWEWAIAQVKVKVKQQAVVVAGVATGVPAAATAAAAAATAAAAAQSAQARQQEKLFRAMPPGLQQVTHFSYCGFTFFTPFFDLFMWNRKCASTLIDSRLTRA